jgi:hypothetical protein
MGTAAYTPATRTDLLCSAHAEPRHVEPGRCVVSAAYDGLPYRSARELARATIVFVLAQLLLGAAVAIGCVLRLVVDPSWDLGWVPKYSTEFESTTYALYLAAFVAFLCWVHRSISNLASLGSPIAVSPSAAVWSFIIPFLNLVRPHQVMARIWTESQPTVANEDGYSLKQPTTIVTSWWTLVIITAVFTGFIEPRCSHPRSYADLQAMLVVAIVEFLLWLATGSVFIKMVRRCQQRQDEQWKDLELRRAAPQPDPNALR